MIYLDYAANTPADEQVINTFAEVSRKFIANPNSTHELGRLAAARLNESAAGIAEILGVSANEIIFTSGASESNNTAIKGIAERNKKYGKHIITTFLEHSSVNGAVAYLQNNGFDVDYVEIGEDGLINSDNLQELMRDTTMLVSICYVDSEVGIVQQINRIGEILKHYPHCKFHVDATQAVGKIPVDFSNVDLVTFAPHKFYGLNGCGILVKKEKVMLEPLIHGGISSTPYRSGTPALGMAAAAEKALALANESLEYRYSYVSKLNDKLKNELIKYGNVKINSNENSVPFILNISIMKVNTEQFKRELENYGIYVSTKSACCAPNTASRPVYAITGDRKRALSTLRISLSHLTGENDIDLFLDAFDNCYKKFARQV